MEGEFKIFEFVAATISLKHENLLLGIVIR